MYMADTTPNALITTNNNPYLGGPSLSSPSLSSPSLSSNSPDTFSSSYLPEYFENLKPAPEDFLATYKPGCIQKTGNFASADPRYTFESGPHHHRLTREILASLSPKCLRLIEEIERQDEEDFRTYGHYFKHFIYSSVKSTTKHVATALMDILGLQLGYGANYLGDDVDKKWSKIQLHEMDVLNQNRYNNLYLLSSVNVFGQPLSAATRKEVLRRFNLRPDNSHGEAARFIVMDSGFKEGIDLFDIKYVHIFEPQMTQADLKQVIGRGTRMCGQKGLDFHPTRGWPLHINIYDSEIPIEVRFGFENAASVYDLYMRALGLDIRLLNLTVDMERMYIEGSVDNELNAAVHSFVLPASLSQSSSLSSVTTLSGGARFDDAKYANALKQMPLDRLVDVLLNDNATVQMPNTHEGVRDYIRENYADYSWPEVVMENKCISGGGRQVVGGQVVGGQVVGGARPLQFTPTQDFVRMYMTPELNRKGVMLIHSTGSGKTCSAIATATSSFEEQGYTILWVTRTTLRADIWKNMFDQVCNESIRTMVRLGVPIPADQKSRMKLLSKAWSIRPMSYKQFSNMVSGKNEIYKALVKRNGAVDPLRKTLIIIDEAHKLYGEGGLSAMEKPDMNAFSEAVTKSYEVSGSESVRLLIMTATPITTSPMEFVKLLNLCRERFDRIEDSFELFASTYLNETGMFSEAGRTRFLDEIAGYVSYLNREKDARSFAQPIVRHIMTPILKTPLYREFDPKIAMILSKIDLTSLEQELQEAIKEKNAGFENIKAESFSVIKQVCEQYSDNKRLKTACTKFANEAIKQIMMYIKEKRANLTQNVDNVKKQIVLFKTVRKQYLSEMRVKIREKGGKYDGDDNDDDSILSDDEDEDEDEDVIGKKPIPDFSDDFHKYDQSSFNAIKTKCKEPPKRAAFNAHPDVFRLTKFVESGKESLRNTVKMVKILNDNLKASEKEIRNAIHTEKDGAKKALLRQMLEKKVEENKTEIKQSRIMTRDANKRITQKIKDGKKNIKKLKRELAQKYKKYINEKGKEDATRVKEESAKLKKDVKMFSSTNEIDDVELRNFSKECVKVFISKLMIEKEIVDQAADIKKKKTTETKKPRANKKTMKNKDENP